MQWKIDVHHAVPGFDFSWCDRITSLSLTEADAQSVRFDVEFHYCEESLGVSGYITFRFIDILRADITLRTRQLWLSDFFVTYNESSREFCAFDEMSNLKWFCEGIEFRCDKKEK